MMDPDEYRPKFKSELLDIINEIRNDVTLLDLGEELTETKVLCRHLLLSILSLIESVYMIMPIKQLLTIRILERSLFEYLIDLRFLAVHNDVTFNRRFANYYKLIKYWSSSRFSSAAAQAEIPHLAREYEEYIEREFPELAKDPIIKRRSIRLSGLHRRERLNQLRQALPGVPLDEQTTKKLCNISSIVIEEAVARSDPDYRSTLNRIVERKYRRHWSGLTVGQRIDGIKKVRGKDVALDVLLTGFNFASSLVHPTPYSLPYFDPRTGAHSHERSPSDATMLEIEKHIYLVTDFSVEAFSETLPEGQDSQLFKRFRRLVSCSVNLWAHLQSYKR